jgi:hypothetical protein
VNPSPNKKEKKKQPSNPGYHEDNGPMTTKALNKVEWHLVRLWAFMADTVTAKGISAPPSFLTSGIERIYKEGS